MAFLKVLCHICQLAMGVLETPGNCHSKESPEQTQVPSVKECRTPCPGRAEQMPNSSSISEFLLLVLADTRQLQLLHFWIFLSIPLAALLASTAQS
ncbi:hypothetical protein ASZ78_004196 [Callipepla squamata]|uniref:Uncharacterized protein n=1 Tax=Callipepla squamata TaxID=9009 RepID=A0A226MD77_CALSU|nr:hypothetical protein ASZ78_004196 [Callipepla squamata]